MFARLRHDAVVGCHHKQREIDPGCAGQHGVHEPLMPGYVDETDDVTRRARQVGKAEFDGDAATLLFLQSIGIDPGQSAHEACLAMIDVPGGADDHGSSPASGSRRARSLPRSTSSAISDENTGLMKRSASLLPPQRARMSHA